MSSRKQAPDYIFLELAVLNHGPIACFNLGRVKMSAIHIGNHFSLFSIVRGMQVTLES